MEIINSSYIIEGKIDGEQVLKNLERYARVCYKSEEKISLDLTSATKLIRHIIEIGHESVLEHEKATVRIICDRGVSHEIVRHRIASYSQESTRYCNYNKKGVTFIKPLFFQEGSSKYNLWLSAMQYCEDVYNLLICQGASPQEARSVLPNSLKTEIVITFNMREWRHFFRLRCSPKAHPQMREITIPLLKEFQRRIPIIFDDINCT